MPVSINNTTLTFNDGSTQTTSAGVKSVNGQTGVVTIATGSGTVTSVATGNGLQGGTITTSGTLSVACPGVNTVGSYAFLSWNNFSVNANTGSDYSAGNTSYSGIRNYDPYNPTGLIIQQQGAPSGTWRCMGIALTASNGLLNATLFCRVS